MSLEEFAKKTGRSIEEVEKSLKKAEKSTQTAKKDISTVKEQNNTKYAGNYAKNIEKSVDNSAKNGIIKIGSSDINSRSTGKGNPNAILQFDVDLNNRQKRVLAKLERYDSRVVVKKSDVKMSDLAALTAKTGDEFAMLTNGSKRMIIRGNSTSVNIGVEEAKKLAKQGYKFSGHTHPGVDRLCLMASDGDKSILEAFNNKRSVIYNSKGQYLDYEV